MELKGRANPGVAKAMTKRFRTAERLGRTVRTRLVQEVRSRGTLPLIVGGVQRGVVQGWLTGAAPKRTSPTAGTLLKVLKALGIDEAPYREYLEHVRPGQAEVHAVCPKHGRRVTTNSTLNRAERRRAQQGLPQLKHRPDGTVEWPCARCSRGAIGRQTFLRINRPGRIRGHDRHPRRSRRMTQEHRNRLGSSHLVQARLTRPFLLCPLCELVRYDREWHQLCWLAWLWHCRRRGLDPAQGRPSKIRRRGPDPEHRLRRNYELLIGRAVGRSVRQLRAEARVSPGGRSGRPRR